MRLPCRDGLASCLLPVCLLLLLPSLAFADGGIVRLSEQQGNYRLTVFTTPTPLRAGPVDVTVLVQDAATGEPASDVQVMIEAAWRGSPAVAIRHAATTEAATNKLYFAATFDLPEPGWYALGVSVAGARGEAQVHFELEAAEPLPGLLGLWPWVGWPVVVILLFSIHQFLIRRSAFGPRRSESQRATLTWTVPLPDCGGRGGMLGQSQPAS
jgi:hypothetical protein